MVVNMKKLFILILTIQLIMTLSFNAYATNNQSIEVESNSEINERIEKEYKSNMEYSLLMNSYKHESLSRSIANESEIVYPDYYAGAFIDEEGDLVVLSTSVEDSLNTIKSLTRNQNTKIVYAKNSYNDLLNLKKTIEEKYLEYYNTYSDSIDTADSDLLKTIVNFTGVGISEKNNKVFVDLCDVSDDSIALFEKYFISSDKIYYQQSSQSIEDSTSLNSGSAIYTVNGSGSIGFRCKLKKGSQTLKGFITAGHVTGNAEFTNVYSSSGLQPSSKIGTLEAYKYGGSVDMAFIAIDSDYEILSKTRIGVVLDENYFTSISEGTTIYMSGSNTEESFGEIESNSYSFTSGSGVPLTDCIKSDYSSVDGDSGGIVYAKINNSNAIVGIHHGSKTEWLFFKKALTIKASNIYATYEFYKY